MKFIIVSVLSLISTVTFASGFKCTGDGYSVKMFNHVDPKLGTNTPAILAVSSDKMGTLAVLKDTDIFKTNTESTVIYSGQTNSTISGRFMRVTFEVAKAETNSAMGSGKHHGQVRIQADHSVVVADLVCEVYLKN